MDRALFERTRPQMAMETFSIVVGFVQLDILRAGFLFKVVNIQMPQATEFGLESSEHRVVGMAGVAGFVGGNAMILKMSGGEVTRIVYPKALPVRFHDVTGQTEGCALRTLHFIVHSGSKTEQWKKEKHAERKNLAARVHRDRGAQNDHASKQGAEQNQTEDGGGGYHVSGAALSLFECADVGDQILDLVRLQALSIGRHLPLAIRNDAG